jgi:glutathione S-transferase
VSFGWGDLARVEHAIESALEEGPWLLGDQFSAADILAASTLQIAFMAKLIQPEGVLFDYVERAVAREGYERAAAIDHREAERLALRPQMGAIKTS